MHVRKQDLPDFAPRDSTPVQCAAQSLKGRVRLQAAIDQQPAVLKFHQVDVHGFQLEGQRKGKR